MPCDNRDQWERRDYQKSLDDFLKSLLTTGGNVKPNYSLSPMYKLQKQTLIQQWPTWTIAASGNPPTSAFLVGNAWADLFNYLVCPYLKDVIKEVQGLGSVSYTNKKYWSEPWNKNKVRLLA